MGAGVMVTFQHLTASEMDFFERLHHSVRIPKSASAVYLATSVREQMLGKKQVINGASGQPDAGVVVASRHDEFDRSIGSKWKILQKTWK
jgi:hypothetical protein